MLVCPASRGKGTRIFEDRQDLKLVEATSFEKRRGTSSLRDQEIGGMVRTFEESAAGDAARFGPPGSSPSGAERGVLSPDYAYLTANAWHSDDEKALAPSSVHRWPRQAAPTKKENHHDDSAAGPRERRRRRP
jgi:hypothetical protein